MTHEFAPRTAVGAAVLATAQMRPLTLLTPAAKE